MGVVWARAISPCTVVLDDHERRGQRLLHRRADGRAPPDPAAPEVHDDGVVGEQPGEAVDVALQALRLVDQVADGVDRPIGGQSLGVRHGSLLCRVTG